MEKLLNRIKNVILADLNEVLEKKEKKNPLKMLNQYLAECERETENVKELIERQYRLREEFQKEYDEAAKLAEKRKAQADIAVKAGESELAEFALKEQQQYEERAEKIKELIRKTEAQISDLEKKYEEMNHKLKDMKIRQLDLMGKENIARVNYKMEKMFEDDTEKKDDFDSYIERLENKVKTFFEQNNLDERIKELEKKLKERKIDFDK